MINQQLHLLESGAGCGESPEKSGEKIVIRLFKPVGEIHAK